MNFRRLHPATRRIAPCAACVLAVAGGLHAANPLALCESGRAYVWPEGGAAVPFNPDQGMLGALDNPEAVALVQDAFARWQGVSVASVTTTNAGSLPEDVDIDNFVDYLFADGPDGLSAVVFDTDGRIFDLLFGANSGILGFAGPEWIDPETCSIVEGMAFLNGPEFGSRVAALDVMTHEFGHYLGLGHSVVNGQALIGDASGPSPFDLFGTPPVTQLETMYPFYFGVISGFSTLEADDVSALSSLYPAPGHAAPTATLQGVIRAPDATTPLSGVNVIARNLADPFNDAVSALSGAYALSGSGVDPMEGVYTLSGLTPGARYVIYTDQILGGGFIRTPLVPLPGPEEFYNGPEESNNLTSPDPPEQYSPVPTAAGTTVRGLDIVFNTYAPGEPLPVGDEGTVALPLPFPFDIAGESYGFVLVNGNGHLTFGAPPSGEDYLVSRGAFLSGPPRIAALWADLDPGAGGTVVYARSVNTFSVTYTEVPEWSLGGSNTFRITLHRGSDQVEVEYGALTVEYGMAGMTGGRRVTSGLEPPTDLWTGGNERVRVGDNPAVYEVFDEGTPLDLQHRTLRYARMRDFDDHWAGANDSLSKARHVQLPFSSLSPHRFTEIEPVGRDVDFYRFNLEAGDILLAEVVSAAFDARMGLFEVPKGGRARRTASPILLSDGPGNVAGLLFAAPTPGGYAIAITANPDEDFQGLGTSGGRYVLALRTVELPPGEGLVNGVLESGGTAGAPGWAQRMFQDRFAGAHTGPGDWTLAAASLRADPSAPDQPSTVAPSLNIRPAGDGTLRVLWTAPAPDWILQHCTGGGAAGWEDWPAEPLTIDATYSVVFQPTPGCRFFRLRMR